MRAALLTVTVLLSVATISEGNKDKTSSDLRLSQLAVSGVFDGKKTSAVRKCKPSASLISSYHRPGPLLLHVSIQRWQR